MKIVIRPSIPDDLVDIVRIFSQSSYDKREKEIRNAVNANKRGKISILSACMESTVVGAHVLHRPSKTIGKNGVIVVDRECRGHEIGTNLYIAALKVFKAEGRNKVTDSVIGRNPMMVSLLNFLGYTYEGCLRKHTVDGKDILLFAFFLDEYDIPENSAHVELEIPETEYMEEVVK
ncbi:MAG: hypothetical protein HXS41_02040 [Theionarchaea archaeon]|nr:hypothetical protein [Theionarchaea archaeon]MBU7001320.1 hypothetical protein [Theionarchaea archaeon]MBU7019811.1 hypothetical protein [Theionarchaea archaeon]MBU7035150.1 hypothetical protein [Theionarchaea archaeon]MBU7040765.1 hypothetical protein [Theionarchaea archaeon]